MTQKLEGDEDIDLLADILPSGTIHLFGGPSGSGKTRLSFQWASDLCYGRPVLGIAPTRPLTIGYVALDRTVKSIKRTFKKMGLSCDIPGFTIISCATKPISLAQVPLLFGDKIPDIILLDGIPTLLPSGDINKYHEVASFLRSCQKICEQYHTTIIGILHSTKTKENERYLNPRQRIAGSVAWAAYSETIFLLEPIKPDSKEDRRRTLWVLPRNAPEFCRDYTFDSRGHLIEIVITEEKDKFELLLVQIPLEKSLTRDNILDLAFALSISRPKCDAFLAQCIEDGRLFKPEYGKYQRRNPN